MRAEDEEYQHTRVASCAAYTPPLEQLERELKRIGVANRIERHDRHLDLGGVIEHDCTVIQPLNHRIGQDSVGIRHIVVLSETLRVRHRGRCINNRTGHCQRSEQSYEKQYKKLTYFLHDSHVIHL